jgi:hypothetical protein
MVAFTVFVYLPTQLRAWVGPFLLVLPLIFRETGVVIAIPFAALILFGENGLRKRSSGALTLFGVPGLRLKSAAIFVVLSAVVVLAVLRSDIGAGRPSLALMDLFTDEERFIYNNAFALGPGPADVRDIVGALGGKLFYNTRLVRDLFAAAARLLVSNPEFKPMAVALLEAVSLGLTLLGTVVAAVALLRKPRDPLLIGILPTVCILGMAILALYFVRYFQAVRILLLAVPFECIACAVLLERANRWLTYGVIGFVMACGLGLTYASLRPDPADLLTARRDVAFLESISHDDNTVLVAPPELALDYVYAHYPVKWSFVPANRETLHLLGKRYPVGTIVESPDSGDTNLTANDIAGEGFTLIRMTELDSDRYVVFKPYPAHAAFEPLSEDPEPHPPTSTSP